METHTRIRMSYIGAQKAQKKGKENSALNKQGPLSSFSSHTWVAFIDKHVHDIFFSSFFFKYCTAVTSQCLATHVEMRLEVFPAVGFLRRLNAVLHKFMDSVLVDDERRAKVSSPHQLLEALHRHNERGIDSG